jgi:hypothetical protein
MEHFAAHYAWGMVDGEGGGYLGQVCLIRDTRAVSGWQDYHFILQKKSVNIFLLFENRDGCVGKKALVTRLLRILSTV